MRLHELVVVVVGLIVFLPLWLFTQMVLASVNSGQWDPRIFAFPAAVVMLVAIIGFAFAFESRRALRELAVLLKGQTASTRSQ